ncbi:Transcription termination factor MTERF15, mitochondrial [Glycine max]|nr:Transcription termination factor MTERF15, mitochondrial [Glycine max]
MVPNFLIARLTASLSSFTHHRSTQTQLGSLLQHKHNAFLFFFNSFSSGTSSDSESDGNYHKGDTFTVSYLINSCGVSPRKAKELSNRINLKTPDGPNAVIDLLNNYGFTKTHLAKLVEKHPLVLVADAENTLLPKLKFFRSIGLSNTDMRKILIANHTLNRSLKKFFIPRYEILRRVLGDDQEVVRAITNSRFGFTYGDTMNLVPNIEVLRQSGVPQASITFLMINSATVAYWKHSRFVEAVNTAKEIGLNPLRTNFIVAVEMLLIRSKAVWESRFEVYERWGWNREMALQVFRKFPCVMKLSEETFAKKMSFLVKDMGWLSEDIAEYPQVIAYNLEKRIIPRFSVIKILKSKGLIENKLHLSAIICITEKKFLENFVVSFQKDLPLLPDVYGGKVKPSNVIFEQQQEMSVIELCVEVDVAGASAINLTNSLLSCGNNMSHNESGSATVGTNSEEDFDDDDYLISNSYAEDSLDEDEDINEMSDTDDEAARLIEPLTVVQSGEGGSQTPFWDSASHYSNINWSYPDQEEICGLDMESNFNMGQELYVGMEFDTKSAVKNALQQYVMKVHQSFKVVESKSLTASFTHHRSTPIQLGSLLQHKHNAFLLFFSSFTSGTSSDSELDGNQHKVYTSNVVFNLLKAKDSPKPSCLSCQEVTLISLLIIKSHYIKILE